MARMATDLPLAAQGFDGHSRGGSMHTMGAQDASVRGTTWHEWTNTVKAWWDRRCSDEIKKGS